MSLPSKREKGEAARDADAARRIGALHEPTVAPKDREGGSLEALRELRNRLRP